MATPHIGCEKKDIAPIVLMPGDPLRAKYIAQNYLDNYRIVNKVRNMYFYTGYYKGKKVTIASSGMGIPSMGIYAYELIKYYNVKKIIRVLNISILIKRKWEIFMFNIKSRGTFLLFFVYFSKKERC